MHFCCNRDDDNNNDDDNDLKMCAECRSLLFLQMSAIRLCACVYINGVVYTHIPKPRFSFCIANFGGGGSLILTLQHNFINIALTDKSLPFRGNERLTGNENNVNVCVNV